MIRLELTLDQVNAVLESLGSQPYTKVVDLINEIRAQALPQVEQPKSNVLEGEVV